MSVISKNCGAIAPASGAQESVRRSGRARRFLHFGLFGIATCIAACVFTVNGFTLFEWWREIRSGVVLSHANTPSKTIAITFDDGPDPFYTPRILEILKRYGVRATFFEQGRLVDLHSNIARQIVAQGHSIGNHTYSHPYLTRLAPGDIRREMVSGERSIETRLRISSAIFRPPRGEWNPAVFNEAVRTHSHIILWTVTLEHHEVSTPRDMADRVLRLVQPGDIILMHDGAFVSRETTVQALPLVLDGLRKRGYQCVTVPELLNIPGNTRLEAPTGTRRP